MEMLSLVRTWRVSNTYVDFSRDLYAKWSGVLVKSLLVDSLLLICLSQSYHYLLAYGELTMHIKNGVCMIFFVRSVTF